MYCGLHRFSCIEAFYTISIPNSQHIWTNESQHGHGAVTPRAVGAAVSWELQTLEMSFLGIFLSPAAPSLTPYHLGCPPLITTLLLFRFLAFRATLGAGISGMFDRGTWESSGGAPSLGAWVLHHTVCVCALSQPMKSSSLHGPAF